MTMALADSFIAGGMLLPPAPEAVVMRFAGDSGDGIQLTGGQFTLSTALAETIWPLFLIFRRRFARRKARPLVCRRSRSILARRVLVTESAGRTWYNLKLLRKAA
jgi:hypothetical protein